MSERETAQTSPEIFLARLQGRAATGFYKPLGAWVDESSGGAILLRAYAEWLTEGDALFERLEKTR